VFMKQAPVLDTLSLPAFWAAIALVLAAFLAATVVEYRALISALDRLTAPPRARPIASWSAPSAPSSSPVRGGHPHARAADRGGLATTTLPMSLPEGISTGLQ
jgi:hypothetical protein